MGFLALVRSLRLAFSRMESTSDFAGLDALLDIIETESSETCRATISAPEPKRRRLPCFSYATQKVSELPLLCLPVGTPIFYTRSEAETDELCAAIELEIAAGLDLVGFDIEWHVSFAAGATQAPAAVVQLATGRAVHVFQVSAMPRFPSKLAQLLERGDLMKAGNNVGGDALKLRRDFDICTAGLIELGGLAAVALHYGERPWSLSDLTAEVLGCRLPKDLRMSRWEARLSEEEVRYAALDAWASLAIAAALRRRLATNACHPSPSRSTLATLVTAIAADPMWSRRAEGRQWLTRRTTRHNNERGQNAEPERTSVKSGG